MQIDPIAQFALQISVSLISGGLAGGCVGAIFDRMFYWRGLRIKFYPMLSDMLSAYAIRMQKPEGWYWINTVGCVPLPEDKLFIDHRTSFLSELVQYSELREVRILLKEMADNIVSGDHIKGEIAKLDLTPESDALLVCLNVLHKKLKLLPVKA
jgi:hypothetical protein